MVSQTLMISYFQDQTLKVSDSQNCYIDQSCSYITVIFTILIPRYQQGKIQQPPMLHHVLLRMHIEFSALV